MTRSPSLLLFLLLLSPIMSLITFLLPPSLLQPPMLLESIMHSFPPEISSVSNFEAIRITPPLLTATGHALRRGKPHHVPSVPSVLTFNLIIPIARSAFNLRSPSNSDHYLARQYFRRPRSIARGRSAHFCIRRARYFLSSRPDRLDHRHIHPLCDYCRSCTLAGRTSSSSRRPVLSPDAGDADDDPIAN